MRTSCAADLQLLNQPISSCQLKQALNPVKIEIRVLCFVVESKWVLIVFFSSRKMTRAPAANSLFVVAVVILLLGHLILWQVYGECSKNKYYVLLSLVFVFGYFLDVNSARGC